MTNDQKMDSKKQIENEVTAVAGKRILMQEGWMWFREVCEISVKIRLIRES